MKLKIIDHGAVSKSRLPKRAKPMDIGADVYASRSWNLEPGTTFTMPLNVGIDLPNGTFALVLPRSSMAKDGISCLPVPIDASYKKQIHAFISNHGRDSYYISEGARIGQLVILNGLLPDFVTEPLEERGEAAFGSTGI